MERMVDCANMVEVCKTSNYTTQQLLGRLSLPIVGQVRHRSNYDYKIRK